MANPKCLVSGAIHALVCAYYKTADEADQAGGDGDFVRALCLAEQALGILASAKILSGHWKVERSAEKAPSPPLERTKEEA